MCYCDGPDQVGHACVSQELMPVQLKAHSKLEINVYWRKTSHRGGRRRIGFILFCSYMGYRSLNTFCIRFCVLLLIKKAFFLKQKCQLYVHAILNSSAYCCRELMQICQRRLIQLSSSIALKHSSFDAFLLHEEWLARFGGSQFTT